MRKVCPDCDGRARNVAGSHYDVCDRCGGTGHVDRVSVSVSGEMRIVEYVDVSESPRFVTGAWTGAAMGIRTGNRRR